MRRLHILLFLILPVLLLVIAAGSAWLATKMQDGVSFRETKYASLEALAKSIDEAAKLSPEASNSASALARIIITSDNVDRGQIQVLRGLAGLLSGLASLQILFIVVLAYRSRPSNQAPQPDAPASGGAPLG